MKSISPFASRSRTPTPPQRRGEHKRSKSSDAIEAFAMSPTIPPAYAFDDPIHQRATSSSANQSVVDDQSMHSKVCEVENDLFEDEQNIHYLVRKQRESFVSCWKQCLFGPQNRPKRHKQIRAALCITLPFMLLGLIAICIVAFTTDGFGDSNNNNSGTRGSSSTTTTGSTTDNGSPPITPGRWNNELPVEYAYYNDTEFWESADGMECAEAFLLEYDVLRRDVLTLIQDEDSYLCNGDDREKFCHCPRDRLMGQEKKDNSQWHRAYEENLDLLHDFSKMSSTVSDGLDVIMYGDEITEGWWGSTMGEPYEPNGQDHFHVYQELFDNHVGGSTPSVKGLAMGIAHDTIPNLIWRMRKGELPNPTQSGTKPPKVIWLLIGYNDFHILECKKEILLIEILNIALFVRKNLPDSTIVVNGMLPASNDPHGWLEDNIGGVDKNPFFKRIDWINKRIECFLRSGFDPNMEYFDAEPFFVHENPNDHRPGLFADPEKFEVDSKHLPSVLGRQVWGRAIVDRVQEIMEERQQQGDGTTEGVIHEEQKLGTHD